MTGSSFGICQLVRVYLSQCCLLQRCVHCQPRKNSTDPVHPSHNCLHLGLRGLCWQVMCQISISLTSKCLCEQFCWPIIGIMLTSRKYRREVDERQRTSLAGTQSCGQEQIHVALSSCVDNVWLQNSNVVKYLMIVPSLQRECN